MREFCETNTRDVFVVSSILCGERELFSGRTTEQRRIQTRLIWDETVAYPPPFPIVGKAEKLTYPSPLQQSGHVTRTPSTV